MQILILSLLAGAGAFSIFCAAKNYDWFFTHRRAQTLVMFLGRTGARIFYITLGLALVVMGIVFIARGGYVDANFPPDAFGDAEAQTAPENPGN